MRPRVASSAQCRSSTTTTTGERVRDPAQEAQQQLEQAGLLPAAGRRVAGGGRDRPEVGDKTSELAPARTRQHLERGSTDGPDEPAQRLADGRERQPRIAHRHAPAGEHLRARGPRAGGELGHQARLAHAGIARHQEHLRLAAGRSGQGRLEPLELGPAADEHGRRRPSRHRRIVARRRAMRNGNEVASASAISSSPDAAGPA